MAEWKEGLMFEEAVESWSDRWMKRVDVKNGEMDDGLYKVVDPDYQSGFSVIRPP